MPRIGHSQLDTISNLTQANIDAAAFRREFNRVRDEIPHDLLESRLITVDRPDRHIRVEHYVNAFCVCGRLHHIQCGADHLV